MEKMEKNKWKLIFCGAVILTAILYSSNELFIKGILSWHRTQPEYKCMMAEAAILFCLFSVILKMGKNKKIIFISIAAILSLFLWAHVVFLPVLISGIYMLYLLEAGNFIRVVVLRLPGQDEKAADFLTGCISVILIFCIMSAVGVGAIGWLKLFVIVTGAFLVGRAVLRLKKGTELPNHMEVGGPETRELQIPWQISLFIAFILTMLCIQAGRMNIAVDFDSLWYGVRSRFILDNGNGIYENLGTIGIVYTYSKGWEVLTLPLADLPSYSFLISVNLWLAAGTIYMAYRLAALFMNKKQAVFLAAIMSSVPGIMNMAITTKTDIVTLLFQEIMIYFIIFYIKEGRISIRNLAYSLSAFFLTWTLKPTAIVFSTAIFGMSILFLLWKRYLPSIVKKNTKNNTNQTTKINTKENHMLGSFGIAAISLAALLAIWARTIIITGLPVTSVFSSVLTKLGFKMKYPFQISQIPNSGVDLSLKGKVMHFARRLFDFLLRPQGEDMDHVILAWSGFILLILFILWILCCFCKKNVENQNEKLLSDYLKVIFLPFLVVNIISLAMLTQVDGNYFMFLCVLSALCVFRLVSRLTDSVLRNGIYAFMIPVMLFLAITSSLTNWSWTVGFTPVSFKHHGYYDHLEEKRQNLFAKGNGEIWNILASDSQTRLIAVGDHPDVLAFPCNVQSYDDITGVWGNVVLVKTMDNFVEFMDYADTDYVYVQSGYMQEDQRCYSLVRTLVEYGKLELIHYEAGNVLAKVVLDGEYTEKSRNALTEFDRCYIKKEVQ